MLDGAVVTRTRSYTVFCWRLSVLLKKERISMSFNTSLWIVSGSKMRS